ncbi:stalk domain-containing protein [Paenibacillus luteus]|uniref:stalk domain-containing protein n=1 Tax=Paenibacillus luteus TaxID=2545753 RepID=UPI0019D64045|nr:stalk domain-containing protein [Paenibacillus luteus]
MSKYKGKFAVGAIGIFLVLVAVGVSEFHFGIFKKTVFTYKVKHYLEQTYSEPMTIKRVSYLWDNIEPLSARVHPQGESNLEFSVYPRKEEISGFLDDYANILWLHQAKEELDKRLMSIESDFKNVLYLDFTCCTTSSPDDKLSEGKVPAYNEANLTFDVTFQLNRGLEPNDLEHMYHILNALKKQEQPAFGTLLFLLHPEDESYRIEYRIPSANLKDIHTAADLKAYNESRFPARELAAMIGANVLWDESSSQVVFTKGDRVLEFNHWGEEVLMNGTPIQNPLPLFPGDHGQVLVPVAVIEEAFQIEVSLIEPFIS